MIVFVFVETLVPPEIPACSEVSAHVKVLPGIEASSPILRDTLLQVVCDADVVTTGNGLTVTVINEEAPVQPPELEVGVTLYTR